MKNWLNANKRNIIIVSYIIPILIASILSINHVISWYDMTNPLSWAIYLSIGIEIAALSALAGIVTKVNKSVYIPFILVTIIQFVGNVFYGYQYIDVNSELFKDWMELTAPFLDWLNMIDAENTIAHKRLLAFIGGGLIPIISLSFLHLLVSSLDEFDNSVEGSTDESEDEDEEGVDYVEDDSDLYEDDEQDDEQDEDNPDDDPVLSGNTSEEKSLSGDTETHKVSGDTVNEQSNDSSNNNEGEQKKRGLKKEDVPDLRKKRKKDRGGKTNNKKGGLIGMPRPNKNKSANISKVDDYDRKRTR